MLNRQLNFTGTEGINFFYGYGEQTAGMWLTFKAAINQPEYITQQEAIIKAADETFAQFGAWLDKQI